MYCDCLLHILPGFTNGPADIYAAVELFSALRDASITSAVVAPTFDPGTHTVSSFLAKRKRSLNELVQGIAKVNASKFEFILSAEVPVTKNISQMKNLSKLCIGKSNYLPVTLPVNSLGRIEIAELLH